jgi:hypothetical protein
MPPLSNACALVDPFLGLTDTSAHIRIADNNVGQVRSNAGQHSCRRTRHLADRPRSTLVACRAKIFSRDLVSAITASKILAAALFRTTLIGG